MMSYSFTAEADRDMDSIDRYLQTLPKAPALQILGDLERAIEQIYLFPGTGRLDEKQTRFAPAKVFRLVSGQYILFYSVQQEHILILGVIHGKRDVDNIMSRRHS